jgi:ribosome-associated toxin RatA of RatAB toxin-antitoxin module
MQNIKTILLLMLVFTHPLVFGQNTNEKLMDKQGVAIYEVDKQNGKNHLKSIFYVEGNTLETVNVLLQTTKYKHWVDNIKNLYPVKETSDSLMYSRVVVGVKNILQKEGIVKTTTHYTKVNRPAKIEMELVANYPFNYEYDKLNMFHAQWIIQPLSRDRTKVELVFLAGRDKYPDLVNDLLDNILTQKLFNMSLGVKQALKKS